MKLYIPSSGRAHIQPTVNNLPPSLRENAIVVVPEAELEDYHDTIGTLVHIEGIDEKGIGPTRQWCIDQEPKKCIMLDDDLRFAMRREDEPTKFEKGNPTNDQLETAFGCLHELLDGYSHVGMATREGGNRNINPLDHNTRLLRILGYRTDIMREHNIRFDQIPVMEDFYVSLSLLTLGFENCKLNWMVQDQKGSGLDGGCSQYRTMKVQADAAHALHNRFPRFVTVVHKTTKTAWGGGTRTDVRIAWKKALQWGESHA